MTRTSFVIARTLAILSFLGIAWVAIGTVQELRKAHALESLPTWPSKRSPLFELEEGQHGTWEVHWDDVSGAVGTVLVNDFETVFT